MGLTHETLTKFDRKHLLGVCSWVFYMLVGPNEGSSLWPLQHKLRIETNMNTFFKSSPRISTSMGLMGARGRVSAAIGANGKENVWEGQEETTTGCYPWRYLVPHRPPFFESLLRYVRALTPLGCRSDNYNRMGKTLLR